MKMSGINICVLAWIFLFSSCEKEELSFKSGDIEIEIKTGDHWFHDFPLFPGISKKNAPQFAIWIENASEDYLSTVFVTNKVATESWQANKGNRRKESLPYWAHQRGIVYADGLMLPTKEDPLPDGITGATPKENKTLQIRLASFEEPVVIKAEFNHSLDFNDFFPENAKEGDENYSGGEKGSGQPAVVYATTIYPDTRNAELELIGHSSPDGSNGNIYDDLEKLTSAKSIVKSIKVTVK